MIVDILLGFFQGALQLLLAPFPTDSLEWLSHVETMVNNLGALNYFLPIGETVAAVVAVFFVFPIFMGISLSLWIIAQLRGSSASG